MRTALVVCLAAFCSAAQAGEPGRLARRISLAASCAASFWDYRTTVTAARYGGLERNSLLADSAGRPRLGLILGVKAGLCAVSAALEEAHLFGRRRDHYADPAWTAMNAITATGFLTVAVHNRRETQALKQAAPPIPSYLAPVP